MNEQLRIPGWVEKQTSNLAAEQEMIAKNTMDTESYGEVAESNAARIAKIKELLEKKGEGYVDAMKQVSKLSAEQLENELRTNNLLYKRKELLNDIRTLEADSADAAQKYRVQEAREELAKVKALQREGVTASQLSGGVSPNMTPEQLLASGRVGTGGRAMQRFERTRVGGFVAREAAQIGGVGSLTSPAGIMGLARANPLVSAGLAGVFAMRGLNEGRGLYIPGVGSVPGTAWQSTLARGQVTGEGYGAGLAQRYEGFRMGFNPFDQISPQIAESIIDAVRGQGFRGAMAREFQNTIKDIYKDTGLPVEQIAELGELYARTGQLDQFRNSMESLDEIAKQSSQSIQNVAATFKQLNDVLVGQGGMANAPLARALTGAVAAIPGSPQQRQQYTAFLTQGAQLYTGLTPTAATTSMGQQMFQQNSTRMLESLRRTTEGMPRQQQDMLLAQFIDSGMLPGITSVDAARRFLTHGPEAIRSVRPRIRQSRLDDAFAAAGRAEGEGRTHQGFRGLFGLHDAILPGERAEGRRDYVRTLEQRLDKRTRLSDSDIKAITEPLHLAMQGKVDWGEAVGAAQGRARRHSEARGPNARTINLRLDREETRRLLGGKNVSKLVQLEGAAEGKVRSVGTAFTEAWPF